MYRTSNALRTLETNHKINEYNGQIVLVNTEYSTYDTISTNRVKTVGEFNKAYRLVI